MSGVLYRRIYGNGEPFTSMEAFEKSLCERATVVYDEAERQVVLFALAELSIARPGWVEALEQIALKMDNKTAEGRAEMFDQFRRNHSNPLAEKLAKP